MDMKQITKKVNYIFNNNEMFHMFIYVPAGSIYEEDMKVNGISHVIEHMLLKHTQKYTENELLEKITELGGKYNASTDKDVTIFYIMTNIDSYKSCIDTLKSVLEHPKFTSNELEIEKNIVIEEIKKRQDNDSEITNLLYETVLDSRNLYNKKISGNVETVKNITISDLKNYFKERYSKYTILINCDEKYHKEVSQYMDLQFKKSNDIITFDDTRLFYECTRFKNSIRVVHRDYEQFSTHLMFPSFPRNMVKESMILNFIEYALVSSHLKSILMYELRSKRGLVYDLGSSNDNYRYIGIFRLSFMTSNKNTSKITKIIFNILSDLCKRGLPEKKLKFYKKSYMNNQEYALTNEEYRSIYHGEAFFYNCDIDEKEMLKMIEGISNDDIINMSRRIFDVSRMGLLTCGKYKNLHKVEHDLFQMVKKFIPIY